MLHRFVHAAIALFWIATMAAVAVHERRGIPASAGAARLGPPRIEPRPMEQFRILFGGREIGTVTNEILPDAGGGVSVASRTEGQLPLLGLANRLDLRVRARLDRASRLVSLRIDLDSAAMSFSLAGEVEGGELVLRAAAGGAVAAGEPVARLRIPEGVVVQPGAGLLAAVPADARPGDRWTFPILNPLALALDEGLATVIGEAADGSGRRLREIEIVVASLTSRAFVDDSGAVVREESPLGLSLERVEAPR